MGLESLLAHLEDAGVTAVTADTTPAVTAEAAQTLAVTRVTAVTAAACHTAAAKPEDPASAQPEPHLAASEMFIVQLWLTEIGEQDPNVIADVIRRICADPIEKEHLLAHARAATEHLRAGDDRHYCDECAKLTVNSRCLAALHGEINASRNFMPLLDLRHRCRAFRARSAADHVTVH